MGTEWKAIYFDWDMTLGQPVGDVTFEERMSFLLDFSGYSYSAEAIAEALKERKNKLQSGEIEGPSRPQEKDELNLFYVQLLSILGERDFSFEQADAIRQNYSQLPFELFAEAIPLLNRLKSRGFQLGIITNNSSGIRRVINNQVSDYVSDNNILISDDLGIHKPHPEIFLEAASRIDIDPKFMVFVGDNYEVDVLGAVDNGNYGAGVWLNRRKIDVTSLEKNTFEIHTLLEIESVLDFDSNGEV